MTCCIHMLNLSNQLILHIPTPFKNKCVTLHSKVNLHCGNVL